MDAYCVLLHAIMVGATVLIWSQGWLEERPIKAVDCLLQRVHRQLARDRLSRYLAHCHTACRRGAVVHA